MTEVQVAQAGGLAFDAIDLVKHGSGAIAAWSDPSGLFVRRVDGSGVPVGPAVKMGERCRGGLSAQAGPGRGIDLVCSRPERDGSEGALVIMQIDPSLRPTGEREVARLGSLSEGVSTASVGSDIAIAFHDAAPDGQRARLAYLKGPERIATLRDLSRQGRAAGPPTVQVGPDGLEMTWSETFLDGDRPRALIMFEGAHRDAVQLAEVLPRVPRPRLFRAFGHSYVAFRDRPRGATSTGLFAVRLGSDGRSGPKVRLGRADGEATPSLCSCGQGLFASTPRVYAGDYFVGVNRLDPALARLAPEQQFYEDAHAFFQVASACVKGQLLLMVAERSKPGDAPALARAVPFTCEHPARP